jgi:hypothetical protein
MPTAAAYEGRETEKTSKRGSLRQHGDSPQQQFGSSSRRDRKTCAENAIAQIQLPFGSARRIGILSAASVPWAPDIW